jgi:hypothetical protein
MARFCRWVLRLVVFGAVVFVAMSDDPDAKRIRRRVGRAVAELARPEPAEPEPWPSLARTGLTDGTAPGAGASWASPDWQARVATPTASSSSEIHDATPTARPSRRGSSDLALPDAELIARETIQEVIPVSDGAFGAGHRVLDSAPGSSARRQAEGELIRESAATTGRLVGQTAREALGTVTDPSFVRGLLGRRE